MLPHSNRVVILFDEIDVIALDRINSNDVREMGYVGRYKGNNVVLLSNSFVDETNSEKVVDDQYAYIMPAGKEKPVKIGIEGGTLIDEVRLADNSVEISAQHMFDVAVVANNYWGIVENSELN